MLLHFLLGVLIVVGVALTVIILFQRSEGGALGMGGGGGGQFMSARGASDLLTRTTQILAALFFILSLAITILTGRSTGTAAAISDLNVEDLDTSAATQPAPAGGLTAPAATVGGPLDLSAPAPGAQTAPVLPTLGATPAPATPPTTLPPAAPAP